MKLFFRITLLLYSLSFSAQDITFDSAAENLSGKVRSIEYKNYKVRKNSDTPEMKYSGKYVFDTSGNLTEKINYGYDNSPDSKEVYKYNNGHLISVISEKNTGSKDKITSYKYNQAGQLIKVIKKNAHGDVEYETTYFYDSKGRLIKKEKNIPSISYTLTESYVYNNKLSKPSIKNKKTRIGNTKETYEYDEQGNLIKKTEYNAVGELFSVIEYTYNEKGDKTSLNKYDEKGDKTYWETYVYEYDSLGNWTKKTTYKKDEISSIETRNISYY